jgi:hypothetical protein
MNCLEIKNLEKYQHYKDRNMVWIKWHISSLQDYKFSKLKDNQKWLFIGLVCLACKTDNKIPIDYEWIKTQIAYTSNTLKSDIDFLIASEMLSSCYQVASLDKKREEENREDNTIVANATPSTPSFNDFENLVLEKWNKFAEIRPVFSALREISAKRRDKLKKRFNSKSFKDSFESLEIFKAIDKQPFLKGENDRGWKLGFDWLIENDTNYLKVLELKYIKGA